MILRSPRDWADNKLKLERAQGNVGPEASDYQLQQEYIKLGGRVIGNLLEAPKIKQPNEPIVENSVEAPKIEEVKPASKASRIKRAFSGGKRPSR